MSEKIIIVLCEGQTEQGFVEGVLKPYLVSKGIKAVKSVLVTTNKKLNSRGGIQSYRQVKNDLKLIIGSYNGGKYERYMFTTMLDLYALPEDFPEYETANKLVDKYEVVQQLEGSFAKDISDIRFVPYIQMHEFEALVLCGTSYLKDLYPGSENGCKQLDIDLTQQPNPELINNHPETAPSKRIIKAIEKGSKKSYHYNKPKTGKYVTERVGIDELRKKCHHFDQWIEKLIMM